MDDIDYNKKSEELELNLKPKLTREFLNTLVEAVKICGWSVDLIESANFVDWCFDLAEVDRVNLEPYLQ